MTVKGAQALSATGRHSDGGGLYLRIQPGGRKSWLFMWKRDGRQREKGLGSFQLVSLKIARERAQIGRDALAMKLDPAEALSPKKGKTFLEAANACMAARKLETMNPETKRKWERTALIRCKDLHRKDVSAIGREDILPILKPIWTKTPETARIARSHIEIIFDYAKGRGWREGDNPAKWRGGLEAILPKHDRRKVKHHPAMAYNDLPVFMSELRAQSALSARALELLILTATRTTEVRECTGGEFDLENAKWSISGERMKADEDHEIPLPPRAVEIVSNFIDANSPDAFVFPGSKAGKPLSNMAMAQLLKRMGRSDVTVHGFRSTFRDWAGDRTNYAKEVAEAALAHSVGTVVERSYRRKRALDKRRSLMLDWQRFIEGDTGKVVLFSGTST